MLERISRSNLFHVSSIWTLFCSVFNYTSASCYPPKSKDVSRTPGHNWIYLPFLAKLSTKKRAKLWAGRKSSRIWSSPGSTYWTNSPWILGTIIPSQTDFYSCLVGIHLQEPYPHIPKPNVAQLVLTGHYDSEDNRSCWHGKVLTPFWWTMNNSARGTADKSW